MPAMSQDPGEGSLRNLFPKFWRIEEWPRTQEELSVGVQK
jgi:hypothetical protein